MVESAKDQMKIPCLVIMESVHYHKLIVSGLLGAHILHVQKVVVVELNKELGIRWL